MVLGRKASCSGGQAAAVPCGPGVTDGGSPGWRAAGARTSATTTSTAMDPCLQPRTDVRSARRTSHRSSRAPTTMASTSSHTADWQPVHDDARTQDQQDPGGQDDQRGCEGPQPPARTACGSGLTARCPHPQLCRTAPGRHGATPHPVTPGLPRGPGAHPGPCRPDGRAAVADGSCPASIAGSSPYVGLSTRVCPLGPAVADDVEDQHDVGGAGAAPEHDCSPGAPASTSPAGQPLQALAVAS
jgi:hypothetical protein